MPRSKILIADDDVGLVRLVKTVLAPLDAEITSVHDATAALLHVQQTKPDLVILDVNMPHGNGLSVCEMLVTDIRFSHVPVIVFTGEAEQARIRSIALGASYIQKGTEGVHHLERAVRHMLLQEKPELMQSQLFLG